jgi:sucrose phosphorylase
VAQRVMQTIESYRERVSAHRERFSGVVGDFPLAEDDAILITYGDTFLGSGEKTPLQYLYRFLDEVCESNISGVHILPWSPYSSDDGFSVIDYRVINPALGSWEDVEAIGNEFRLMADLVLNHCSAQGPWFQAFLRGEAPYDAYFIEADPAADYSQVVRPRALPLLTEFPVTRDGASRTAHIWTTFSADQVDLNWENPDVLVEMLDVFLSYLAYGAQVVRLDAIAYLWKEMGHPCLHHPNTHRMVKLFRRAMELLDGHSILITETNVPHRENVSYFGDGDEAHMVYNFPLPPLVLDAMVRGDATHLRTWAERLEDPGPGMSFFNFCASHDGIGLTPTHGILSDAEREELIKTVEERGGRVSYKATADGEIPYELNINYLSAVTDPLLPDHQRASMFLVSQAIMLAFAGVPGIYVHSLIGSENWQEGVAETGANRTINREKLRFDEIVAALAEAESLRGSVFSGYRQLLAARGSSAAFHPRAAQRILSGEPGLFALVRGTSPTVLALHNVSAESVAFRDRRDRYPWPEDGVLRDLITDDLVVPSSEGALFSLELAPYEVMWLQF